MTSSIIEGIIEIIFVIIFDFLFYFTGEIILSIFTFGERTIARNKRKKESLAKSYIFMEISVWIGFLFWISVIIIFAKLFT